MIWPCLDEHPPDCLPLERNGCPRPDEGYCALLVDDRVESPSSIVMSKL